MKVFSEGKSQSGCLQHHKHFKNEFKKLMTRSLFVVMAAMAVIMSPAGDNLQDIWNSPGRIETIEADINEINERLSLVTLDENRIVTSVSE